MAVLSLYRPSAFRVCQITDGGMVVIRRLARLAVYEIYRRLLPDRDECPRRGAAWHTRRRTASAHGARCRLRGGRSADAHARGDAEGVPRIGVAGGDGTVEVAVQDLARTETALGILPQGTFNNFATALRLPHN